MSSKRIRALLALTAAGAIGAAAILSPAPAHADGVLSVTEARYVALYHGAVCSTIAEYPSEGGVMGVMQGVMEDGGFAGDDAVDIINASVETYRPKYWPLLVAIGRAARASGGQQA